MGISKSAFKLFLIEMKKGHLNGKKILQLGRQHTFITLKSANNIAKKLSFQLSEPTNIHLSFNEDLKTCNYLDDITLFSLLGFTDIHSLDVSSYEQSTIIHDLNQPIPVELHQQYDVIYDGGTLEHVFHIPEVFKNIHSLLKSDGVIIHASPSHNHVDHGFYMFSPIFFHEYYSANHYNILTSYFFEYSSDHNTSWKVFEYVPGCLDPLSFGGFENKMVGIWFVAKKESTSTAGVIPQQGAYNQQCAEKTPCINSFKHNSSLKGWLKKNKLLRSIVIRCRMKINRFIIKNFKLTKVGNF